MLGMKHVIATCVVLWPADVAAQTLGVAEDIVIGCFETAQSGGPPPLCIGQAASQCQNVPGGDTTVGMAECIVSETEIWDAMLNAEYKIARARLAEIGGEDLQISLRDAQRAWIAFRDAECALQYDRWQGGTIRSIVYANCILEMTATRALMLRDIGRDVL